MRVDAVDAAAVDEGDGGGEGLRLNFRRHCSRRRSDRIRTASGTESWAAQWPWVEVSASGEKGVTDEKGPLRKRKRREQRVEPLLVCRTRRPECAWARARCWLEHGDARWVRELMTVHR